ncbi:MAG: preprotein translocase subunit SecG [Holosporales bacterium]|jgi:preprotein translocase subunit SecG|nr:preprotein translocase subunit SecG [Holosporales bacterium]
MGILLALHVLVTIMLILIVLIQKNEGGSSLFANSGGGGMFNARGASNMLTKATWTLASIFIVNCVVMATLASRTGQVTLITKRAEETKKAAAESQDAANGNEEDDGADEPWQGPMSQSQTSSVTEPKREDSAAKLQAQSEQSRAGNESLASRQPPEVPQTQQREEADTHQATGGPEQKTPPARQGQ